MDTKTAQHTPGPWTLCGNTIYDKDGKGVGLSAWKVMAEFNTDDHAIFLEGSEKEEVEARANACLMAVAPEMLQWLIFCEQYLALPEVQAVTHTCALPPNLTVLNKLIADASYSE